MHSEDEEKRRVAVATEERKARERADKAAYELMMEEEAKPKEGPEEKSTKKKKLGNSPRSKSMTQLLQTPIHMIVDTELTKKQLTIKRTKHFELGEKKG